MGFKIIFESSEFLIIDKPSGLVVNRSKTIKEETLQDQLSRYFGLSSEELGVGGRAGIVHRLDRETSGLLLVAKTTDTFDFLQAEFAARHVNKEYVALVHGLVTDEGGNINLRIGRVGKFGKFGALDWRSESGRETETSYKVLKRYKFNERKFEDLIPGADYNKVRVKYLERYAHTYTLLTVYPKTGRTHQIRVALKSMGHPVVSDAIYTPGKLLKFDLNWCPRLFLHAAKLSFRDPKTKELVSSDSDLPRDLKNALSFLTSDKLTINN